MRSSATLTYCDIRYSQAKAIHRLAYESYVLFCAQNLLNGMKSNLRGKPWKIYDQSGMTENVRYDFKGNLLETKRQFSQEYKQTIDWETNPAMENEEFVSATEYDALNRATSIRTPRNSGEIMPEYDEGGLLKTVKAKLRNAAQATEFVKDIAYNPKGQRERITYGNGATTKYEYDEKTFRLTNLLTTRNNGTDKLQDLNYSYDQMGNITGIIDNAQQTIFFSGQVVNPSQEFEYDALYRLVKATGREHASINADSEPETEGYNQAQLSPEDGSAMRLYQRQWQYDNVGNILQLIHQANNNNWTRNYNYATANNRLLSTEVGNVDVNYTYNPHGSMTTMPHLQNMEWNFAEQLNRITRGTTEAYYNYDASGQRMRKVVEKNNGSIIETRLYFGWFEIFRKKSGNTIELERETLHIMDNFEDREPEENETKKGKEATGLENNTQRITNNKKRVAIVETKIYENGSQVANPVSVQRYQLSNNIESATLEIDENASIISYEEYYPYGDTSYQAGRNASEVSQKRYRYTGKEKDEESGLYYHGARYYACWLVRWTAADPVGLAAGVNLYMYCGGNPVNFIDTSGLTEEKVDGGLNVLILVGISGGQGRNFEIAAETFRNEHPGDNVEIVLAQDTMDIFEDVSDEERNVNPPISMLLSRISNTFGDDGIDKFVYFGHSYEDGLSVFSGERERISDRWLNEKHINSEEIIFNEGAEIFLMGCKAGARDNPVAQKIANNTGTTVFAFTSPTLGTANPNRINIRDRVTEKELSVKFSHTTKKIYYFGQDGKGLKKFNKQ
jgi:RHS repeat-associated protein